MTEPETILEERFANYEPALATLGKALRAKLRARLPGLHEIVYVYENQGALVVAYSPSERGIDGLCSFKLEPGRLRLYFGKGAQLAKADPGRLLQGRGKTVRHLEIMSMADFERPEVEVLMVAALELAGDRPAS
ncbi:MAG: hypothetical protein H6807_11430 [Planctomycetes bacterium]|nr:hypothetical protein [Planctomycetota bacterium]